MTDLERLKAALVGLDAAIDALLGTDPRGADASRIRRRLVALEHERSMLASLYRDLREDVA